MSTHRVGQKADFPSEFCQHRQRWIFLMGFRKEIQFLYLHYIVSKVKKDDIPSAIVVNIDQTPLKYVPVGNEIMTAKGEHSVTIEVSLDKRSITGRFAILFDGNFLPVQLVYGGKTTQSLPRFNFPKGFQPQHKSQTFFKHG